MGPAGITFNDEAAYFLLDNNLNKNKIDENLYYEVQSLDEMCLITKKEYNLRFNDNQLNGFHFYGLNLCLNAKLRGLKSYSINAWTYHESDGYKNLNTKEKYEEYENSAKNITKWANTIGIDSWRTTTASCKKNQITLYPKKQF